MKTRGQTMVLFALMLFACVAMVAMTASIADHAQHKVQMQTMADMGALSNATATARAFNTFSLLNRTAVSHWVALLGVEALRVYAHRPASEPFWRYFYSENEFTNMQAREHQEAVVRTELLSNKIFYELQFNVLADGKYVRGAINAAYGKDPGSDTVDVPGYRAGTALSCREVCHAVLNDDGSDSDNDDLDLAEVAQAVLGSRGFRFTVDGSGTGEVIHTFINNDDIGDPGNPNAVKDTLNAMYNRLDDDHYRDPTWNPSGTWSGVTGVPTVKKPWTSPATLPAGASRITNWSSISAVAWPVSGSRWNQPSGTAMANRDVRIIVSTNVGPMDPAAPKDQYGFWTATNTVQPHEAYNWGSSGATTPVDPRVTGTLGHPGSWWPHDFGVLDSDVSMDQKHPGVFRGGFGLVDAKRYLGARCGSEPWMTSPCPQTDDDLYGQPKMPASIWYIPAEAGLNKPWEILFKLNLRGSGASFSTAQPKSGLLQATKTNLLGETNPMDFRRSAAFATGMVYYHRRGHLREPANMLNPFWRAAMVPIDIDRNGESTATALGNQDQMAFNDHEAAWAAGWRPGDMGVMMSFAYKDPGGWAINGDNESVGIFYKLVTQGGFKGVQ